MGVWVSLPEQGFEHWVSSTWAGVASCGVPTFEYGVRATPTSGKPKCSLCDENREREANE